MLRLSMIHLRNRVYMMVLWTVIAYALMLPACMSTPPPKLNSNPIDERSCVLGLKLKLRTPVILSHNPDLVVFARIDEGVAITESFELYGSTYAHDGYVYLANAEPGNYVVVAAIYDVESTTQTTPGDFDSEQETTTHIYRCYFSCDLIEQTHFTITPGSFAFMGSFVGNLSRTFGDGDDCQRHIKGLVEEEGRSGVSKLFLSGESSVRVSPREKDMSEEARKVFLMKAREHFATTGWTALIDAELSKTP